MLERLNWFRQPDLRPEGEIDDDIAEELRAHLAACADDLIAEGLSPEEAEREARRRFGDFDATLAACKRVKMGDRIMLLRANLALMLVALPVLALLFFSKHRQEREARMALDQAYTTQAELMSRLDEQRDRTALLELRAETASEGADPAGPAGLAPQPSTEAAWRARYAEQPDSWRHGLAVTQALFEAEGAGAFGMLAVLWPELSKPHREQAFKPFVAGRSADVLELLALGAADPDAEVRGRAYSYLQRFALRDFSEAPGAFEAWWEQHRGLPPGEVIELNARLFVARLELLSDAEVARELRLLGQPHNWANSSYPVDFAGVQREAGAQRLAERWLLSDDVELRKQGIGWLAELGLDPAEQRSLLLPFLDEPETAATVAHGLGRPGNQWAVEPLVDHLLDVFADAPSPSTFNPAAALGEIGDPAPIPDLIGMIVAHDDYESVYGVGYFALSHLTGVQYDESHDGAWWLDWWSKNRTRFPAEVAGRDIPVFRFDR